ncbi:hypothetical protein GCM10010260_19610 [Streptomyces filipinensis]|uniref:HTH luxR-type domain-containing protein n=1 Tax=Streptomyces filipinensis TaxID=66887 RepID=A0A918MA82_9ACTN|nr:hypothetical protein GCM10010260_19610 [Streptomyces filipinensis]
MAPGRSHPPREDRPATSAGPDATGLEVLSLLLAGLTDASVAEQLDLGLRTVQRRMRRLMELAGVATRLRLGWHAYERGWMTRSWCPAGALRIPFPPPPLPRCPVLDLRLRGFSGTLGRWECGNSCWSAWSSCSACAECWCPVCRDRGWCGPRCCGGR